MSARRSIPSPTARKSKPLYSSIRKIDGSHPFKENVPGGFVAYQARYRPHGKVAFFNFELAKEIGLLPKKHDEALNVKLERALLETFAIQIINEFDIINKPALMKGKVKPNTYMATRYLQMQHKSRTGMTSGDGRSLWNGTITHQGKSWDVSSCGTGATCLSPATGNSGVFFESGDPSISYGCGYAELSEGLTNAIFSEILHNNQVPSERTLLVIEFPKGTCISVRISPNLIRPSHFFVHLKQGRLDRLRSVVDLFIKRQIDNRVWDFSEQVGSPYLLMLEQLSETFAEMSARFEREYIFCWLDWDGDNILADGTIIDYGSIRQFGLYHHEYRFDDVERWSTNIKEQRLKARYIVQTFAQMVDFLTTGKKRPVYKFSKHPILGRFDRSYERHCKRFLLNQIGFEGDVAENLLIRAKSAVDDFSQAFFKFESAKSRRGFEEVGDGLTWNAIFCMRDILRELPEYMQEHGAPMSDRRFINVIKSNYATNRDCRLTEARRKDIAKFQSCYQKLVQISAKLSGVLYEEALDALVSRSAIINRFDRITGDGMAFIGQEVVKKRRNFNYQEFMVIVGEFIKRQTLVPDKHDWQLVHSVPLSFTRKGKNLWRNMVSLVQDYREGL